MSATATNTTAINTTAMVAEHPTAEIVASPGQRADDLLEDLVRLRPALRARAFFLTRCGASADDLVQDVMERALRTRHRFQPGSNLSAWLHSIMRNLFVDGYRRRIRRVTPMVPPEWAETDEPRSTLDVVTMDDVLEALQRLTPADREIFTLAHLQQRSYRDISSRLGIPINTTGTRLLRVRSRLRRLLSQLPALRSDQEASAPWPVPVANLGPPRRPVGFSPAACAKASVRPAAPPLGDTFLDGPNLPSPLRSLLSLEATPCPQR